MAADHARGALFRVLVPNQPSRVTYAELFFDLVFVYAVTQISHLPARTPDRARRAADDAAVPRRLVGLGLHHLGHQLAQPGKDAGPDPALSPDARRPRACRCRSRRPSRRAGSGSHWPMPRCRSAAPRSGCWRRRVPASRAPECDPHPGLAQRRRRCSGFTAASSEGQSRLELWGVALAIEYVSPLAKFWTPGIGASTVQDWFVEGGHMAERCAGFIIIALGESIVVIRRDLRRSRLDRSEHRRLRDRLCRLRRDVGNLFQPRRRGGLGADLESGELRPRRPLGLYLISTCRSWPASSCRPLPTRSC